MKKLIWSAFLLFVVSTAAKANLPKLCYQTADGKPFCTTDNLGKVQVFIYSAGWCHVCNADFEKIPATYAQFEGQAVFVSLSSEGWEHGDAPDGIFLREWQERHNIPFPVAGSFRDVGKALGASGRIPFVAIVDKNGKVTRRGALRPWDIADEVRRLLN